MDSITFCWRPHGKSKLEQCVRCLFPNTCSDSSASVSQRVPSPSDMTHEELAGPPSRQTVLPLAHLCQPIVGESGEVFGKSGMTPPLVAESGVAIPRGMAPAHEELSLRLARAFG